jgi:hypothetical protein
MRCSSIVVLLAISALPFQVAGVTQAAGEHVHGQWVCRTVESKHALKGTLDPSNDLAPMDPASLGLQGRGVGARALGQTVFVDFDSGTDGFINYTSSMRSDILAQLADIYQDFSVTFTATQPGSGDYSTVFVNAGDPGGVAQQIDFRNLDPNDDALVNVSGLGISGTANIVNATAVLVAHELGHLLGLRHADSFGALGDGVSPLVSPASFLPSYPGPQAAIETNDHVMVSPASVGSSISDLLTASWFSERSAMKLQTADTGAVVTEAAGSKSTIATAQPVSLQLMPTPNTIVSGSNAGPAAFSVRQLTILGALSATGEIDFYEFESTSGEINIEVISGALSRYPNFLDTQIRVYEPGGSLVGYFASTAFNDDELENLDSTIIDLTLPSAGTYYLEVRPFNSNDTGNYELYVTEFGGALASCPADLDGDGEVGTEDLAALLGAWNSADPTADFNDDGVIDTEDLSFLLGEWGVCS